MSEVQSQCVLYEDFDRRRKRIRLGADGSLYWSIERAFAGKPYRPIAFGDVSIKGVWKASAEVWLLHFFVHQQHEDRYDRILPRLAADLLNAAGHQLPPELEAYNQPAPIEAAVLPPNGRTLDDGSPAVFWTAWPEWETPPASAIATPARERAGPTASGSTTPEPGEQVRVPPRQAAPSDKIEAVERTIIMLGKATRQIALVEFLAKQPGCKATIEVLAKEIYKKSLVSHLMANIKNTRDQIGHARANLERKRCPLRIQISGSVVRLIDADPVV
jgi:hypothetical protein